MDALVVLVLALVVLVVALVGLALLGWFIFRRVRRKSCRRMFDPVVADVDVLLSTCGDFDETREIRGKLSEIVEELRTCEKWRRGEYLCKQVTRSVNTLTALEIRCLSRRVDVP